MSHGPASDPMRPTAGDPLDGERHLEIARSLFRESNDALFLFDTDQHRVLDVNPAAMRLTGFARQPLRSLRLWDLFTGESPAMLDRVMEAYKTTGFYHSREGFAMARREGGPIPVNLSVSRIHVAPAPIGLVVARDVSERKEVEKALRDSEARFRLLIEAARVVFWTLSPDGRMLALNPQFATVTGWSCDAWVGRPLADLLAAEDRDPAANWLRGASSGELPPPIELKVAARSGATLVVEFLPTSVVNDGGVATLSGIARDVTEGRRVAEALRRAEVLDRNRMAAEAADRAKTEFLAHVSHEIRTPLTAVLGFTNILLGDEDVARLPEGRREDLRLIERNGRHLLDLIDDLLVLSEIEAGKLRVTPVAFGPSALAREVVASMAPRARERSLTLEVDVEDGVPLWASSDPVRLRQILMNLVGNAVKFTDAGEVKLRVSAERRPCLAASLVFDVVDTGPGMTADEQANLFRPFYRSGRQAAAGSGLGLAISRRLAERLGGRIEVHSTLGRGSTFRLVIPMGAPGPAEPSRAVAPPLAPASSSTALTGARILVVEDNESIQRVLSLHLEKSGAAVTRARNGQEAVDLAEASGDEAFDLVLMDMQMPILDGYEATRQLRARGYGGTIVALTAHARMEDREECLRIGCDDHVSKPVDWARLEALIAAHLGRAAAPSGSARTVDVGA